MKRAAVFVPVLLLCLSQCGHPTPASVPTPGGQSRTPGRDSVTTRVVTGRVIVTDSMIGNAAGDLPDSVARQRAMVAASKVAQRAIVTQMGDTLATARDTSAFGRAMLVAQRASAAVDSIAVSPTSIRLTVGGSLSLRDSVRIQAFDAKGQPIARFAPFLQIEDPQVAQLNAGKIVALREGETVLLVQPIPVPRPNGRAAPVARVKITVTP